MPRLNCRDNRRRARQQRVSTVYRALSSLEAAGLVRFRGVKRENGQWRCLSIGLTPAGYGAAGAFGRSRRGPVRCPGNRISFSGRSGTSPPVATAKNRSESVGVRAHAREGPPEGAGGGGGAFLAVALAAAKPETAAPGRRPWPNERFDLLDAEVVDLVELFEQEFGWLDARFSYQKHGPILRRILDRFDRYADPVDGFGTRVGYRRAAKLFRQRGALYRTGNRKLAKVKSMAYFLPILDQQSKKARREWKARHGVNVWGPTKEAR